MVNLNIAFDDEHASDGDFFTECKQDLIDFLDGGSHDCNVNLIQSSNCNEPDIKSRIGALRSNFLFVAYCHGKDDSLQAQGCGYITSKKNTHLFKNSLFYSVACLTGKDLGHDLIENGCRAFIGYIGEVKLPVDDSVPTIKCVNQAIKKFFTGSSLKEAFHSMRGYYDARIDVLYDSGKFIQSVFLADAAASLIILGDQDLTINEFK